MRKVILLVALSTTALTILPASGMEAMKVKEQMFPEGLGQSKKFLSPDDKEKLQGLIGDTMYSFSQTEDACRIIYTKKLQVMEAVRILKILAGIEKDAKNISLALSPFDLTNNKLTKSEILDALKREKLEKPEAVNNFRNNVETLAQIFAADKDGHGFQAETLASLKGKLDTYLKKDRSAAQIIARMHLWSKMVNLAPSEALIRILFGCGVCAWEEATLFAKALDAKKDKAPLLSAAVRALTTSNLIEADNKARGGVNILTPKEYGAVLPIDVAGKLLDALTGGTKALALRFPDRGALSYLQNLNLMSETKQKVDITERLPLPSIVKGFCERIAETLEKDKINNPRFISVFAGHPSGTDLLAKALIYGGEKCPQWFFFGDQKAGIVQTLGALVDLLKLRRTLSQLKLYQLGLFVQPQEAASFLDKLKETKDLRTAWKTDEDSVISPKAVDSSGGIPGSFVQVKAIKDLYVDRVVSLYKWSMDAGIAKPAEIATIWDSLEIPVKRKDPKNDELLTACKGVIESFLKHHLMTESEDQKKEEVLDKTSFTKSLVALDPGSDLFRTKKGDAVIAIVPIKGATFSSKYVIKIQRANSPEQSAQDNLALMLQNRSFEIFGSSQRSLRASPYINLPFGRHLIESQSEQKGPGVKTLYATVALHSGQSLEKLLLGDLDNEKTMPDLLDIASKTIPNFNYKKLTEEAHWVRDCLDKRGILAPFQDFANFLMNKFWLSKPLLRGKDEVNQTMSVKLVERKTSPGTLSALKELITSVDAPDFFKNPANIPNHFQDAKKNLSQGDLDVIMASFQKNVDFSSIKKNILSTSQDSIFLTLFLKKFSPALHFTHGDMQPGNTLFLPEDKAKLTPAKFTLIDLSGGNLDLQELLKNLSSYGKLCLLFGRTAAQIEEDVRNSNGGKVKRTREVKKLEKMEMLDETIRYLWLSDIVRFVVYASCYSSQWQKFVSDSSIGKKLLQDVVIWYLAELGEALEIDKTQLSNKNLKNEFLSLVGQKLQSITVAYKKASLLDPLDPKPWIYEALTKGTIFEPLMLKESAKKAFTERFDPYGMSLEQCVKTSGAMGFLWDTAERIFKIVDSSYILRPYKNQSEKDETEPETGDDPSDS